MQHAAPAPTTLSRILGAAARACAAAGAALSQDAQRHHEFRMKHGYAPHNTTFPTMIRAAAAVAVAATLGITAVAIAAMVVYQDHVITFIQSLE